VRKCFECQQEGHQVADYPIARMQMDDLDEVLEVVVEVMEQEMDVDVVMDDA